MSVRPASETDVDAIARVERDAGSAPWSRSAVLASLEAPTTLAWVVGEPVVGHLLASCVEEDGEILTLAVLPDARRRGHASALLRTCEETWRASGVRSGWLEVREDNVGARALYARHGWVDAGVRPRYYSDGSNARVMRWSPS